MSKNTKEVKKPVLVEYLIGATAAMGAGLFTNPIDVIKVRLQMQGELLRQGTYKPLYKSTFHAAYVIASHEGIAGLQSGILSALAFQAVLNGIKVGVYKSARSRGITVDENEQTIHTSEWAAYKSHWQKAGIFGLYRQCFVNTPRIFNSAAIQLTTLSIVGDWLKPIKTFSENPVLLTFCSALVSGTCVAIFMQPFDVISIRLYNQGTDSSGKGLLYRSYFDAYYKIFKIEGFIGLYKGVFSTWMRIGPHTVLCFCFYEQLERIYCLVVK
ncbi:hypothetical protein G9C98_005718 [Cotesia typhae]|uniref:Uncharacterized protein n=1 Tax=Cotesia typhae TaxID=2053667 RepID=A0A8J5R3D0_9HYME|nr:hypothetical protein G9C98_005718 [Cotesia typhae]